jgi:hypothetical protein
VLTGSIAFRIGSSGDTNTVMMFFGVYIRCSISLLAEIRKWSQCEGRLCASPWKSVLNEMEGNAFSVKVKKDVPLAPYSAKGRRSIAPTHY